MMKEARFSFEDLKLYQKALDFVEKTYALTDSFPKSELYGLTNQYRKASVSIALNIAEGSGDTDQQFNRFLNISNGSIRECVVCSTIAKRLHFITEQEDLDTRLKLQELSKMLTGLKKYLNKKV